MIRLLKLQLRNVFHQKLFYVCTILLMNSPLMNFIGSFQAESLENDQIFSQITSFLSSEVNLISIIFIALFSCFDFTEGTTKNIIARGYTRGEYLFSKYIVSIISLFIMYIMTIFFIFLLFANNGLGYQSNMLLLMAHSLISIVTHIILFVTLSVICEKNGSAIIACLFVPMLVPSFLDLIDSNLKINLSQFWLDNLSSRFISDPVFTNFCYSGSCYFIYLVLFIMIGYQIFKGKEIK